MDWKTINQFRQRSKGKYQFYFGTYDYNDYCKGQMAKCIPKTHVGWGRRAIEMRANKTHFDCFENDALGLTDLMRKYGVYEALDKIKDDTLVAGCGFLAVAGSRVLPFTALEATGTFDWNSQRLNFGVAAFTNETTKFANGSGVPIPQSYIKYYPEFTIVKRPENKEEEVIPNPTGRPLIGLLTHHATTMRPFGNSVLSRPARDAEIDASRTLKQAMVSAYYYNSKVDVLLGVDAETGVDKVEGQTGDVLKVGTNQNGQIPQIGQFSQHVMTPFSDTMMLAARNFCADTKLSLANLGISSDAPQSPEALEIVGDDLKDDIAEWHSELGQQLKDFAVTLYMLDNQLTAIDENLQTLINQTVPVFKPIYRSDLSKAGDALIKIGQVSPAALKARSIWRRLGLTSAEIDEVIASIPTKVTV